MSDLIVLTFAGEAEALAVRDRLIKLQQQQVISLEDAAVAVCRADGQVKVRQITNLSGAGALGGAFWGALIGFLVAMPWVGLAVGAATGALAGKFSDMGVDDQFIKEIGNRIVPGQAALFLYVDKMPFKRLQDELTGFEVDLLQTSFSADQEKKLRALLETPEQA
jgi:uncharacterized membrane protein